LSDFTASALLALAKARYGEQILRNRMAGAGGDGTKADAELLTIAEGVVSRVQAAAQTSVGWPLPGADPDSETPWREAWPKNLLQQALVLFDWRTRAGFEAVSIDQRKIGETAEAYFVALGAQEQDWGLQGPTDVEGPQIRIARQRDGSSTITRIPDGRNTLDAFKGGGWDWAR